MAKKTLRVCLEGGLGNQLFGLACGLAITTRHDANLILDSTNLKARKFELDSYGFECVSKTNLTSKLRYSLDKTLNLEVRERDFRFDPRIQLLKPPAVIKGYFQSWKYFDEIRTEILKILESPMDTSSEYKYLLSELKQHKTLIVHIRRGDYKNLTTYHGMVTENYLKTSIDLQLRLSSPERIWVFSDSPEDVKSLVPNFDKIIGPETLNSPAEILGLMKCATSFVGSNSSLSWWAAYLNQFNSVAPIFPTPWFQADDIDTKDLLLPGWVSIQL